MKHENSGKKLYIATFNAEKHWREHSACLPSIRDTETDTIVGTLDELLFIFCNDDILFTRYQIEKAQLDYISSLGFKFTCHSLYQMKEEVGSTDENICKLLIEKSIDCNLKNIFKNTEFSPYSIDKYSRTFCLNYNIKNDIPDHEIVETVNSKLFSYKILKDIYPDYQGLLINSSEELINNGSQFLKKYKSFIIKDFFGVSGNGNILIDSTGRLESIARYILRQENDGLKVQFILEPLYDKEIDFSYQVKIAKNGAVKFYPAQIMLNRGYSFSGIENINNELGSYIHRNGYSDYVNQTIEVLSKNKYFGPVCIDSMIKKDKQIVPIIEINARMSMGLINCSLNEYLGGNYNTMVMAYSLRIPKDITYDQLLDRFYTSGVLYQTNNDKGVIPMSSKAFCINNKETDKLYRGRLYIGFVFRDTATKLNLIQSVEKVLSQLGINIL